MVQFLHTPKIGGAKSQIREVGGWKSRAQIQEPQNPSVTNTWIWYHTLKNPKIEELSRICSEKQRRRYKMNKKEVFKLAKGFRGRAKNCIRIARERVEKALQYSYRDRRNKKRDMRSLWIQRINAGTRQHGVCIIAFSHFLQFLLCGVFPLFLILSKFEFSLVSLLFCKCFLWDSCCSILNLCHVRWVVLENVAAQLSKYCV